MEYTIGALAARHGITVRALRWYDSRGLLHPRGTTEAGYRIYTDAEDARLGQILFYRELGFPLAEIAALLDRPDADAAGALARRRELLLLRRRELDRLISTVSETITRLGRESTAMKKFDSYETARREYAAEARERWGGTAEYAESERREKSRGDAERSETEREADAIFAAFAALAGGDPASAEAQALVRRWQEHITARHYECTDAILASLGEMYAADERFTANLDRFGKGAAAFMSAAIAAYVSR